MARPWPRTRSRRTFVFIIAVALLTRAIALFSPLTLSGDAFRYIWDGRVQAAGINPYRYVPADERLALLRDGWKESAMSSLLAVGASGRPEASPMLNRSSKHIGRPKNVGPGR